MNGKSILALNGGSSSLKFGLYAWREGSLELRMHGEAEDVGGAAGAVGKVSVLDAGGKSVFQAEQHFADVRAAADVVLRQLEPQLTSLVAIAHRIVHGGPEVLEHQRLTSALRAKLEAAKDFAPLHTPPALAVVDAAAQRYPAVSQVICLDTAFHRTMPERARRFPLPDDVVAGGVQRYGAHGLSLESAVALLAGELKPRCIIAHLGGGCSVTAVRDGCSADTTMGLTPTGGMMMGTRTGDLDPGLLIYLLRHRGFTADSLEALVDRRAGILGIDGRSSDVRSVMESAQGGDLQASLALEMFCYEGAQAIAKMAVALGEVDQLVFTGGVGEHAADVRARVCEVLRFMGIALDADANAHHAERINSAESRIEIRIVPAEEELRMAHIAAGLCA